ncbi:MAG: 3-phosphoshikimate 1-carboxyvinyltransferase [Alphaproteobacteria bacterium]
MRPLISRAVKRLQGSGTPPGDKSISHRALMLGSVAVGRTRIGGLLEGEDILSTAAALRQMGSDIVQTGPGSWAVSGCGVGGLTEPGDVLDLGNSGTGARLLMGLVATHPFKSFFTGDASLRKRPMGRVVEPLTQMGARFEARAGNRLPLMLQGAADPLPIVYTLKVPSAQVKSAVLLAGLNTPGATSVIEPEKTRDHTERMLRHFGAKVEVRDEGHARHVTVTGYPELVGSDIVVPGDPSSAAFALVAALLVPEAQVTLNNVGTNPLRTGLYQTLREMGADLAYRNERNEGGEPVADIVARASKLKAIDVPAERAPSMIDEYPILAAAAACADGSTRMNGLAELRVKESDRLAAVAAALKLCGVEIEEGADYLVVHGTGKPPRGPFADARIATHMDHRIAMSFLVLGTAAERPVAVDDGAMIDTSFPDFAGFMNKLGARIETAK